MNKTVIKLIVGGIFSAILLWIYWMIKAPFRINSSATWWETIGIVAAFGVAGILVDWYDDEFELFTGAAWIVVLILICIWTIIRIGSADLFHARERYEFVSQMVTVVEDTDEISAFPNLLGPNNDTSNLPLIGLPEAIKRAETEMGRRPALGSQFEILEAEITSQNINGSLMYVVPLEPKNFFKWDENGNRGYFIIDRNNGNTEFIEESLFSTEKAPFGDNARRIIQRYMLTHGISGRITELSPEVTDDGQFNYVATVYTTGGIEGLDRVTGVIELNPYTRECQYYALDEVPEYIDRVFPEWMFKEYVKYYGSYKNGFWNSVFSQKEVLEMTKDFDVIYIDGVCYYYTGYTSAGKGESSNGIMLMNCRTGEIEYHITYGIAESRAMGVAEGRVQEKGYTASYPLLLMIGGEETYFMLMRDASNNLCGYAFVNYKDYTKTSVNESLLIAQTEYIKSCATTDSATSMNNTALNVAKGNIFQISNEVVDGNTVWYVRLGGNGPIFAFHSSLAPEIVFAEEGWYIEIKYVESDADVISAVEVKLR